ncbi:MAG: acyltransferase family protein [Acidimicrobiales bacterium]
MSSSPEPTRRRRARPVPARPAATGPVDARSAGTWCAPFTGFRVLAAVAVIGAHSCLSARTYPVAGIVQIVAVIVPMFFVVSAYALYRPFIVDDLRGVSPRSARSFWWRRFLRIYPLYAVALTAYLVLLPPLRPPSGSVVDYAKLYGFLQVYDPDLSRFSGIPAAWFLCDEVAFYLLMPFIALAARWVVLRNRRRRHPGRPPSAEEILRGHLAVAVGLWVVGFVARPILVLNEVNAATALPISNLDFYALGIFVSVATLWERAGLKLPEPVAYVRERPWLALGGMVLGATVIALAATDPAVWTPEQDVLRYLMYTVMAGGAMTYFVLGDQRSAANTWFGDRRWGWLAILSLHLYLWHQLVLGGFDRYVTEVAELHIGPRFTTGLAVWVGAVAITVAISAALRPVLDWPYARWAHDAQDTHRRRGRRPSGGPSARPGRPGSSRAGGSGGSGRSSAGRAGPPAAGGRPDGAGRPPNGRRPGASGRPATGHRPEGGSRRPEGISRPDASRPPT